MMTRLTCSSGAYATLCPQHYRAVQVRHTVAVDPFESKIIHNFLKPTSSLSLEQQCSNRLHLACEPQSTSPSVLPGGTKCSSQKSFLQALLEVGVRIYGISKQENLFCTFNQVRTKLSMNLPRKSLLSRPTVTYVSKKISHSNNTEMFQPYFAPVASTCFTASFVFPENAI